MPVIDADAHVIETDRTWEFLEDAERKLAPVSVTGAGGPGPRYWLVDGRARQRDGNVSPLFPLESREMLDVSARLRHLDELGIDIQVLYPSILQAYTDRPAVELAFCKSYNRWLADAWGQSNNRLRWAAILPLLSIDQALPELRFARDHGACGVFIRTIEGTRQIFDPYFFPVYEEAMGLDVPICVHASVGNTWLNELYTAGKQQGAFPKFQLSVLAAFHQLVFNDVPKQFARLRFGFVETGSNWVPYILKDLLKRPDWRHLTGPELMRENRLYVACETQDDLPYILSYAGEDNLVLGSDYGHSDPHMELNAMRAIRNRTDVEPRIIDKIVDDNARALYGL